MYYYLKHKDTDEIVAYCEDRKMIESTLKFCPYAIKEIFETEDRIISSPVDGHIDFEENLKEELEEKEKERIKMLCMTRLDFIKALESVGISWTTIKGLMEMYPEVEKELMMCSNVYRGNPLIGQFASSFGISSEVLDNLFITHNNESEVI